MCVCISICVSQKKVYALVKFNKDLHIDLLLFMVIIDNEIPN